MNSEMSWLQVRHLDPRMEVIFACLEEGLSPPATTAFKTAMRRALTAVVLVRRVYRATMAFKMVTRLELIVAVRAKPVRLAMTACKMVMRRV